MRALIDRDMITPLMSRAGHILKHYFFYDWDDIDYFEQCFAKVINGEHTNLYLNSDFNFKAFLWSNSDAKEKFTANFLGFFLIETLEKFLQFNELELMHFENILLKFLKEVEPVEHAQEYERANHRNPFTPL